MARTKKQTQVDTTSVVIKPTKIEGNQTIDYQGTIKVTTMHGKKVVKTKDYHNSGLPNLFKFLGMALGGRYTESLRPRAIKLFYVGIDDPEDFDWDASGTWAAMKQATPFIPYDITPVLNKVTTDSNGNQLAESNQYYTVTYHFRISQSYISNSTIRCAIIYPDNSSNDKTDACAYYLFKENVGTTEAPRYQWDDFGIPEGATDYSLVIEWTMSIMNKA